MGCRTRRKQDRRGAVKESGRKKRRVSGIEGFRTGGRHEKRDSGLELCKTRGIRVRVLKTGVMLEKGDTVLLGCRTGGMPGPEECRTGRIQDMTGEIQDRKIAG